MQEQLLSRCKGHCNRLNSQLRRAAGAVGVDGDNHKHTQRVVRGRHKAVPAAPHGKVVHRHDNAGEERLDEIAKELRQPGARGPIELGVRNRLGAVKMVRVCLRKKYVET